MKEVKAAISLSVSSFAGPFCIADFADSAMGGEGAFETGNNGWVKGTILLTDW